MNNIAPVVAIFLLMFNSFFLVIIDLSVKTLINQVKEKQHFSDVFKNRKTRKVFTAQRALHSSNFKKREIQVGNMNYEHARLTRKYPLLQLVI